MNEELIDYYQNLLILQYRKKPRALGTIESIIRVLMIFDLMRQIENGYCVEDAVGVQLDVLAKYTGAQRVVTGIAFNRFFFAYIGYILYDQPKPQNINGFVRYNEEDIPDGQFFRYSTEQESIYSLTDQELRMIIHLKIAQNNTNHSVVEIDNILSMFFPNQVIFSDNFNMAISYIFDSTISRIINIAVAQKAIPKPAGVELSINFVPDIGNIFSFARYLSDPANFAQGFIRYSQDQFGSFLRY